MMRVCHLNTCPVGIATQDPKLREKFEGKPEHVVNFMMFIASELREYMAQLGFRTVDEMVGQVECLDANDAIKHWKASNIDFSAILYKPLVGPDVALHNIQTQDHGLEAALDVALIDLAKTRWSTRSRSRFICRFATPIAPSARCSRRRSRAATGRTACLRTRFNVTSKVPPVRASAHGSRPGSRFISKATRTTTAARACRAAS